MTCVAARQFTLATSQNRMPMNSLIAERPRLTREEEIRHGILRVVSNGTPEALALLADVTEREWLKQLHWLDVSGMALYLFDRLRELDYSDLLPASIGLRLKENLADNTLRTKGLIAEAVAIRDAFERSGLSFALSKGISLSPDVVPRPELRSQIDIDFLIALEDIPEAERILKSRGYYLHAANGRNWDFKTYAVPSGSMRNLYRDVPWRTVELHTESTTEGRRSRLAKREKRLTCGVEMPVQCASDAFIAQGLHLFKHASTPHYRASQLVEFHRHLRMRRGNENFWRGVKVRAAETGAAAWALGVSTLLVEQVLGECAPESFASWTVARLSRPVRLWIEMYGWRSALGGMLGNKLYLLLVRELEKEGLEVRPAVLSSGRGPKIASEVSAEPGPARVKLIPRRLPPMVLRGQTGETLRTRAARFHLQLRYVALRLRFHLVETLRLLWQSRQWRRHLREIECKDSPAARSLTGVAE
jgi:Uncharacterised nucleotidyltransferase